jgi:hypothetical protein
MGAREGWSDDERDVRHGIQPSQFDVCESWLELFGCLGPCQRSWWAGQDTMSGSAKPVEKLVPLIWAESVLTPRPWIRIQT